MVYRVYLMHIKTGKQEYIRDFYTAEDAIRHIAKCYRIDSEFGNLGDYYYFMK